MAAITKRELVIEIADKTGLTQQQVFNVIQYLMDDITAHLAKNQEVVLRNFGTFEVKVTKPKVGRNTNDPAKDVPIPARAVVKFKPGKELKEKVGKVLTSMTKKKPSA